MFLNEDLNLYIFLIDSVFRINFDSVLYNITCVHIKICKEGSESIEYDVSFSLKFHYVNSFNSKYLKTFRRKRNLYLFQVSYNSL